MTRADFATLPELHLLAALVAGEAIGEPFEGQLAVAFVVMNRVKESALFPWWGRTVREVCLAPKQFSCFDDPHRYADMWVAAGPPTYSHNDLSTPSKRCQVAAWRAFMELEDDPTLGASHYFAWKLVTPKWAAKLVHTVTIAGHAFYKVP